MLKALLISKNREHIYSMCCLLRNADFEIDLITTDKLFVKSKLIRNTTLLFTDDEIINLLDIRDFNQYHLIKICDENLLKKVLCSNIDLKQKLKLLPVTSEKNFNHLCSKIELSKTLSRNNIATPSFYVAKNKNEAIEYANKLYFPILIKIDYSSGGNGVFECKNEAEIKLIAENVFENPVLVQKKIDGTFIDMSAFYQQEKLIHFDYCKFLKTTSTFGVSIVREYYQAHEIGQESFEELKNIGKAMGLNGFANISCIKKDDKIYFIEVDARANIWVNFSKYIGNDPSCKINKWFRSGEFIEKLPLKKNISPNSIAIPHFFRLSILEILLNRYMVLKYLPKKDIILLLIILYDKTKLKRIVDLIKNKIRTSLR